MQLLWLLLGAAGLASVLLNIYLWASRKAHMQVGVVFAKKALEAADGRQVVVQFTEQQCFNLAHMLMEHISTLHKSATEPKN